VQSLQLEPPADSVGRNGTCRAEATGIAASKQMHRLLWLQQCMVSRPGASTIRCGLRHLMQVLLPRSGRRRHQRVAM